MRYLFFDTETTGLPRDYTAPATDVDNWPRMVEIAWLECVFDASGDPPADKPMFSYTDVFHSLVKPGGEFTIPQRATAVHGITTEMAENRGAKPNDVLGSFFNALNRANIIVAHNTEFDKKIVGAEAERLEWSWARLAIEEKPSICTMISSTGFCAIPGCRIGQYKWPKLSELYVKLFGEMFENAHDAASDVKACADAFFEMKRIGIIE